MKNLPKWLSFAAIMLAFAVSTPAQQMTPNVAKVIRLKGNARYATANNVWQPLQVGDVLHSGAIIQTAADSRVDLVLGNPDAVAYKPKYGEPAPDGGISEKAVDQDFVRVFENSVMAIDKLLVANTGVAPITETQLDVRAGHIFGTVKKLSAGSKYEIKIPNAIAGIRGTIYSISADGVVSIMVGSSGVAYSVPGGNIVTQVVNSGQSFDCRTGQFSPIPQDHFRVMQEAALDARTQWPPQVQAFPEDHTTHYISPTQGHNNQGQNNNHQ
jgi:hypothetical protein